MGMGRGLGSVSYMVMLGLLVMSLRCGFGR